MNEALAVFAVPVWAALTGSVSFVNIPGINGVPVQRCIVYTSFTLCPQRHSFPIMKRA